MESTIAGLQGMMKQDVDSKGIFIRRLIHENEIGMLGQKRSPIIPKTTEYHPPHCESSAACFGVKAEFPTNEPFQGVGCR